MQKKQTAVEDTEAIPQKNRIREPQKHRGGNPLKLQSLAEHKNGGCLGCRWRGIDTEYWRQSKQLYLIFLRFVEGYLACYYPNKAQSLAKPLEYGELSR